LSCELGDSTAEQRRRDEKIIREERAPNGKGDVKRSRTSRTSRTSGTSWTSVKTFSMKTFSDESTRSLWDLNQSSSEKLKCDFKLWNLKCLSVKSF